MNNTQRFKQKQQFLSVQTSVLKIETLVKTIYFIYNFSFILFLILLKNTEHFNYRR